MIIRWICKNCNKKWIYPVEKCVHCKGHISKQKGTMLKVIGITKVNIPSPMHPITPYNIILLEDEHGSKMPKKTMKEYSIGDNYVEQRASYDDAVSVVKKKYDAYEAVKSAVELANQSDFFMPTCKFLIKPSIAVSAYCYQAATTNPEVVNAVIQLLLESGVKKEDIIVAEQGFAGVDAAEAASRAGILEVCKKHGIQFQDISKGPFEHIGSEMKFSVFKESIGRKIINIPVMKTSQQFGISGSVENLLRLADEPTQTMIFENDFDKAMPKLAKAISENSKILTIADATLGMQGQGPTALGEPAFLNLVFASGNSVNIDAVFCDVAMLDIPLHILESESIGIGKSKIEDIEVVGNEPDALRYPLKKAEKGQTAHPDISLIEGKACSSCFNSAISLTSKLVGLRGEKIAVAIGPMLTKNMIEEASKTKKVFIFGDCAISKLKKEGIAMPASISEKADSLEQLLLLKKLLTTKGKTTISTLDRAATKITKAISHIIGE